MATRHDSIIETQEDTDAEENVTETTPLVKNTSIWRSGLLRRLRESVLIKSKAANMVLFWSALVYLLYGIALNPHNIFTLPVHHLFRPHSISSGDIAFINIIGSGVYAVIALALLFYPLAGYLADVRYGRYKVVICGMRIMWIGLLILIVAGTVISVTLWSINHVSKIHNNLSIQHINTYYEGLLGGLGLLTEIIWSIGFAAFAANVIQFGTDQLQDRPVKESFLFIHWFLMLMYTGVSVGKVAWSTISIDFPVPMICAALSGVVLLLFLLAMPISLCVARSSWFIIDTGLGNPYREVAEVVRFARKHKVPLQRSAFTYWEDDIPTGLDLGKSKYGGPFTTEQVENVKAFFGILYILLSLGPYFTADVAASATLPILKHHLQHAKCLTTSVYFSNFVSCAIALIFANGGTLYAVFIVVLIPIYLIIIHPLFPRLIPNLLKRIGIGFCLIGASLLSSLLVDTIGHTLPSDANVTSLFDPGHLNAEHQFIDAKPLNLNPYLLYIPNFLVAAAHIMFYGGVFEFICAQSPQPMKGVLIGALFGVKGLFQLIGVLGVLLPFSFWKDSNRVGLVYYTLNIVITIVGVVAFSVAARRYQYRQREEVFNERKFIEEYYEKNSDFTSNTDLKTTDPKEELSSIMGLVNRH